MTSITIHQATLAYHGKPLFDNLNLTLTQGECACLLGPSGVGKTSLLRFIANLSHEDTKISGNIQIGDDLPLKDRLAYMAQSDCLMPWLTVFENVVLGFRLRKQRVDMDKAKQLLHAVGLSHALKQYPASLSGGMRQRAALARTLMEDKPIVLMDEPFASLDAITKLELQDLSAKLLKNKTVFLVTHDPIEALRLADIIYVMSGNPASLQETIQLKSPAPRDPQNPDLLKHQATLIYELRKAKENSL